MASPTPPAPAPKAPPAPTQGTTSSGRRGGRGGGRGRGRGRERGREGERERRPAVATDGAADAEGKSGGKRDKQGTGGGGKRRGGGARAATAKPRAARGRKGSGGGSGGPAAQKKLLVRNIPHGVSEEEACAALEAAGVARESIWRFVEGKAHGKNRAPTPARAYLDVKKSLAPADALIASLDGQTWPPTAAGKGDEPPAAKPAEPQLALEVAFAPYQKIPRDKVRKDAKVGTIDRDPEFLAFLEELNKPKEKLPSADVVADSAEGEQAEKPVAALVKYLNERKPRDKSKGKAGKADKNAAGRRQGGRKKEQKGTGSKDKSKKERQKKKKADADPPTAGGQDVAKARKPRGNKSAAGKKELGKNESSVQPGMVRIMAPKDQSARSPGSISGSATTPSTPVRDVGGSEAGASDKPSQGRGQKGGGGGSRGRGRKEGKAGEVAAGSTDSSGKPVDNSKGAARPRRESRAGTSQGSKPNVGGPGGAKGDKKKRAFAPKADATGAV